jgi:type 1 glutamine amidotransferase
MPMYRQSLLFSLFACWLGVVSAAAIAAEDDAPQPLRIHLISGSGEYKSEASLRKLKQELTAQYQVEVTASWATDGAGQLDNLDALAEADLLVVFARRLKLDESQMKLIRSHWQTGKPVVGIRTAGHAFQQADNQQFDRQVLGGHYAGHHGNEEVHVTNHPEAQGHALLRGVEPFSSRKLYKAGELPPGTLVLQMGDIGKARHPVTIVNEYQGGRMFFTSLGVPADFEQESFRRLLRNAIFWTTRTKAEELRR